MKIWNRSASAGCTIWSLDYNPRETSGSTSWKMMRAGKTLCVYPRRAIRFRKRRAWKLSANNKDGVVYILCRSDGRKDKDRAIREKQETKLIADLQKLQQRVAKGRLKEENKIQRAIGRLQERYPRVARYYEISYDAANENLAWKGLTDKKAIAKKL